MNNRIARRPVLSLEGAESLISLSYMVQATIERAGVPHGLSPAQMRLGAVLRDRELTMTGLGKLLDLEKSTVTLLVDRTERLGLVRRVRSSSDRRAIHVQLTERGRNLDSRLRRTITGSIAGMFGTLSGPQAQRVSELLVRVTSQLIAERA